MRLPRKPALVGVSILSLALLLAGNDAWAASEQDVQTVGEKLACYCGCSGLTVAECTCGTADAIRDKIRAQLDSGLNTDQVVDAWVAERGEQILALPTREGFNLVGWVMPFVVTLVAVLALTLVLYRRHRRRPAGAAAPLSAEESDYLERVEQDLKALYR